MRASVLILPDGTRSNVWRMDELNDKYERVQDDQEAEKLWRKWFDVLLNGCLHGPNCHQKVRTLCCHAGCQPSVPMAHVLWLPRVRAHHSAAGHGALVRNRQPHLPQAPGDRGHAACTAHAVQGTRI